MILTSIAYVVRLGFLLFVLPFSFALACLGCSSLSHPLSEVADQVPLSVVCPVTDGSAARDAIAAYQLDPEAIREGLVEQAKSDPVSVACLLLDARTLLLASGQRAAKIYEDVQDGLKALGVQ